MRTRGLLWRPNFRMWVWVWASFGKVLQVWSWKRAKQRCSAALLLVVALEGWWGEDEVVTVATLMVRSNFGLMAENCILIVGLDFGQTNVTNKFSAKSYC